MPIDKVSLGNKLKRCRENLKLDISDISINIGLTNERINAIEKGLNEPTGDEILIFSDFYKQDYKYFISNEKLSASEEIEILYRKFGTEFSKKDRWAIQEFIFLCENEADVLQYIEFPTKTFDPAKYSNIYKQQGTETADKLRAFLGYKQNELYIDIYSEFRKIGIHIFRRKLDNSNISGLFIKHPKAGKCILVNYDEDIYRQNFTLSHEVCHAILDTDIDYNVSFKSGNDYREIRANTFASSFLIPNDVLNDLKNVTWTNELIFKTAIKLKVNIQPFLISLKSKKHITENEYSHFMKLKIPQSEKQDYELKDVSQNILSSKKALLEKGISSFYVRNCHEAYTRGFISSGKLAEILLVNELELQSILGMFNLKLDYEH